MMLIALIESAVHPNRVCMIQTLYDTLLYRKLCDSQSVCTVSVQHTMTIAHDPRNIPIPESVLPPFIS